MYFSQTLTYGRRDLATDCLAEDVLFLIFLCCINSLRIFFGYLDNLKRQRMTNVYKKQLIFTFVSVFISALT